MSFSLRPHGSEKSAAVQGQLFNPVQRPCLKGEGRGAEERTCNEWFLDPAVTGFPVTRGDGQTSFESFLFCGLSTCVYEWLKQGLERQGKRCKETETLRSHDGEEPGAIANKRNWLVLKWAHLQWQARAT